MPTNNPQDTQYIPNIAGLCQCCVCQGKHCLVSHPGHSHYVGTAIYEGFHPMKTIAESVKGQAKETRVVDPETGGAKGSKLARFDMIPPDVLWELAEHYGKGEQKYPSDEAGLPNWMRGYNWELSYAAMQRHLVQWALGEDKDAETGSSHLIAVMWHAAALRWFELHGKGRDYRAMR